MDARDIASRRMHAQRLWGATSESPEDALRWLTAMQAQEFPIAKWSVAQRADGVTNADVDGGFADGAILRTHLLRPTWHFVLPEDIRWLLDLTAPRVHALNAHYYRKLGLDDELLTTTNALLAKALAGGRHRTRKELVAELERHGIEAAGPRLGYIMMHAELDAVICSGPMHGKQHTYAALDERAPKARVLDREDALAELTRRYFAARGPATLKDFVRWSSLTTAEGRRGLEMVGSELVHEEVDGRTYWFTDSPPMATPDPKRIDLVQVYDEVVMSYSESRDMLTAGSIAPEEAGFNHAVLLDGRWIGRWRTVRERDSVVVETSLHRELDRRESKALRAAVDRYGSFLGVLATLA